MRLYVRSIFLAMVALVFLTACGGLPVERTPLRDLPEPAAANAQPAPIGFQEIRFAIPAGTPTVSQSPKGLLGLLDCEWPYSMVQTGIRSRSFPDDNFKDIFLTTLKAQGYDVAGNPGRFFDEAEDEMRTIYAVGGQITDVKIDTCKQSNVWGIDQGRKGESGITVNWTVFDMLNRRKVYEITTKGYGNLASPNQEGLQILMESALEAAIHNLGADPQFHSLVFYGHQPDREPENILDVNEQALGVFDPREGVVLPPAQVSTAGAIGRMEDILKSTVLIQTAGGHGSGFFITQQGHILTNAHVAGNAMRVRVVTSGKKEKLTAEVLRLDRRRDVALLRLEDVPGDLNIRTLPVRLDKPQVGEEVYAIGAPRLTRLQDTVTKGIVSAHRFDRRENQPYIQADADIYGGNSGGPLLDEYGNVIGISVEGFTVGSDVLGGLNWFVPIGDALEKLEISFDSVGR